MKIVQRGRESLFYVVAEDGKVLRGPHKTYRQAWKDLARMKKYFALSRRRAWRKYHKKLESEAPVRTADSAQTDNP